MPFASNSQWWKVTKYTVLTKVQFCSTLLFTFWKSMIHITYTIRIYKYINLLRNSPCCHFLACSVVSLTQILYHHFWSLQSILPCNKTLPAFSITWSLHFSHHLCSAQAQFHSSHARFFLAYSLACFDLPAWFWPLIIFDYE